MKVAPVHVFALPEFPAKDAGSGTPPGKAGTAAVPLKSVLGDGRKIDVSPDAANHGIKLISEITWPVSPQGDLPSNPQGSESQPASFTPSNPPAAAAAVPWTLMSASKEAWPWLKKTSPITLLPLTEGMSQAQVVQIARSVGIPPQQANGVADVVLESVHSHGGHAVLFGVMVGGAAGALATFLGYKKQAVWVAVVAGILGLIWYLNFGREQNPFAGQWTMNTIETVYQAGAPPHGATDEIAEDNGGLKVSRISIREDGKREHLAYHIDLDGKQHPSSDRNADSVVRTMNGNTIQSVYSKNGQAVESETRTLSADQKRMTVTTAARAPTGELFKNVAVYERK